jgi:hypothetical protein
MHDVDGRHQAVGCDSGPDDGPHRYVFDEVEPFRQVNISYQDMLPNAVRLQRFNKIDEKFSRTVERPREIDVTDNHALYQRRTARAAALDSCQRMLSERQTVLRTQIGRRNRVLPATQTLLLTIIRAKLPNRNSSL